MRQPGALHHARFMAKGLYILKIAMLADERPHRILMLAQFILLFCTPYFLTARLSTAQPRQDLTLWENMCEYRVYDRQVADAVKASIKLHQ